MTTTGTPAWLATQNDRAAFRLLLAHGPLSRSQLGALSGMSKPTAGQMIARLERAGLISPTGEVTGSRGPNATSYGVRTDSLTGVAISMLEGGIEAVLVDPTDAVHPLAELTTTGPDRTPVGDITAAVVAACAAAGVSRDSVSLVVIGVQAAVDSAGDRLSFTDTLPGWPERGARAAIEQATGLTVIIENDVNLATLAEAAATGLADFAYLWLGEGLGAGLDAGGHLHRGASGSAGEIGYLEVPRSALAIDPNALDFTDLVGGPGMMALLGCPSYAEALAALPGNDLALDSVADRIALLVETLAAVVDPAQVVLGGPTAFVGGERLADLVHARVATHRDLPVLAGRAGAHPVLLGARRLLVESIRERLEDAIVASAGKED
ncbi:MAG TPA: ROK family transcriptional regulator [Propionicimonas sp.]|uniref:ROK family transcriptional regulator n=1 Tax=Propionicimonas sp. TaxID=1955623 RepID=UPI002F423341